MNASMLPLVGATVTAVGIAFALLIAWRSRTIAKPKLSLALRIIDQAYPPMTVRKLRGKLPHAIFIIPPEGVFASDLHLPIALRNSSSRPMNKIAIEVTYPEPFFISNQEVGRRSDRLLEMFGSRMEVNEDAVKRFIKTRYASPLGPCVRVRYELGTLTPGEPFVFTEMFLLPDKESAFAAGYYEATAFKHVLSHMRGKASLRAAFPVQITVFSELTSPKTHELDLVLCTAKAKDAGDPLGAYADAYWLGSYPGGERFVRQNPFSRKTILREVPVDLILVQRDASVSPKKDGFVALTAVPNPQTSSYGIASLFLPGYDPRRMPAEVTTAEEALRRLGFVRSVRRGKSLDAESGNNSISGRGER